MTDLLKSLARLHDQVEDSANGLARLHGERLKCGLGCSACCVDDLTVFEVEAERIRRFHPAVLNEQAHPPGACAFLNERGACRVYQHRPYVCRTQGLPLRWLEEDGEDWLEYRDICPLNEEGPPLEELDEDKCWTLGPTEGELSALQQSFGKGNMRRVALRDLFTNQP